MQVHRPRVTAVQMRTRRRDVEPDLATEGPAGTAFGGVSGPSRRREETIVTGQAGQVLIVGADPAGMALAYLLARHGVDVTVLDENFWCGRAAKAWHSSATVPGTSIRKSSSVPSTVQHQPRGYIGHPAGVKTDTQHPVPSSEYAREHQPRRQGNRQ